MEIVPLNVSGAGGGHAVGLPFNRRNVEEWSRMDSLTGMMEKAKIETDRWSASNSIGKHNFAKVVDSRERNRPDGSLQQKQRKQMEMFQTMVPGGSMQVIRTQTVTSSSSSSWSSGKAFGELQLPLNSLDLTSQKTKGSVGRSGSISGRRPPSRPRSLTSTANDSFANMSAECHRLHEQAKARMFQSFTNGFASDHEDDDPGGVVITEIDSSSENSSQKTNLNRQKSCSNEDVNDDLESGSIQRSSKFRRSLQIPKTAITDDIPDWTNGKSLKERAVEIENLLRRGSTTSFEKVKEDESQPAIAKPVSVKSSFVSAETLQEVRDRLRKSSNSDTDNRDDGIVPDSVCVKDFVTDFEGKIATPKKESIVNDMTSSMRSNKSSLSSSDWIRRRKSYGFEKVDSDMYGQSNGESSTDSGLGTPADHKLNSPFRRFLNEPLSEAEAAFTRKSPLPIRERSSLRCNRNPWLSQLRGTKLVDRDWSNGTPDPERHDSGVPESPKDEETKGFDFENGHKKQKKVEFCKTEVHFAAEPGRFHIVETDGKPPSSAVLRRSRRRSGSSSPPSNPLGLPEVKFGDSDAEKKYLGTTSVERIDNLSKRIESELKELSKIVDETLPKKDVPIVKTPNLPKLYDVHEEQTDPDASPRSILKNFRNSFHAGDKIDSSPLWKSTVVLRNKLFDDVKSDQVKTYCSDGESELKIRFRNLQKTDDRIPSVKPEPITVEVKRRSFPDEVLLKGSHKITTTIGQDSGDEHLLSVAERIKQAEQQAKGYSSKVDIRFGEATVLQNGTMDKETDFKKYVPSWPQFASRNNSNELSDAKTVSNPPLKRFPTKETNTTTTRISINIPCETKPQLMPNKTNKPAARSWSFGAGSQRCEKPQSASLVMKTIQDSEILKNTKPVHEIINKFDSLARPVKTREQRRRTMPINYKAPKEYTHADLEEELRNFTEDLDKDFRDIYEEEIGSLKGSCRDLKKMFEQVASETTDSLKDKKISDGKAKTLPLASGNKLVNGYIHHYSGRIRKCDATTKISTQDNRCSRFTLKVPPAPRQCNGLIKRSSRLVAEKAPIEVHDSGNDSDLLADEEVRSYMSAGQAGSESDDPHYVSQHRKKTFQRIRLQFKRLEQRDHARRKDSTIHTTSTPIKPTFVDVTRASPVSEPHYAAPPKVASISLRYEDDPTFNPTSKSKNSSSTKPRETASNQSSVTKDITKAKNALNQPIKSKDSTFSRSSKAKEPLYSHPPVSKDLTDRWEKTSNSSSTMSDSRSRERASYLSGPSLSEKYSKTNSSLDNLFEGSALQRVKEIQENLRNSFRSSRDSRFRQVREENSEKKEVELTLDELSQAANDMVVAANGLTDDSFVSSSEDDDNVRKVLKKGKIGNLGTISEGQKASVHTPDTKRAVREKSLSSRATRLMQRASNREAAIAQRSSSEDIPANCEPVKKKLVRRPRPAPVKIEKEDVKICSRARIRPVEVETSASIPRERAKTVSSAAKEVSKTSSSRCCQMSSSDRTERTKTAERRELLSKADALAEQSIRNKRVVSSHSTVGMRNDSNRESLTKRRARVSLRKVEAGRVSQAV